MIDTTVEGDMQDSGASQRSQTAVTPELSELQVARRRRTNILLALGLAVMALAFFFSAMLIDFESMQ